MRRPQACLREGGGGMKRNAERGLGLYEAVNLSGGIKGWTEVDMHDAGI